MIKLNGTEVVEESTGEINLALATTPALSVEAFISRYEILNDFVSKVLKEGVDYGTIPGLNKPTLFKPGAEKLCIFFGFTVEHQLEDKTEDWPNNFVIYRYSCTLRRDGNLVALNEGSANSKERAHIGKSVHDVANTVLKMAQKRAQSAAALSAIGVSDYFTQDMEDAPEPLPSRGLGTPEEQRNDVEIFVPYALKNAFKENFAYRKFNPQTKRWVVEAAQAAAVSEWVANGGKQPVEEVHDGLPF